MTIVTAIIVAISTFVLGVLYSVYIKALSENKMLRAALFGELVVLCGAVTTVNYVENHWYLIPAIIGGFLGTLLTNGIVKLLKL